MGLFLNHRLIILKSNFHYVVHYVMKAGFLRNGSDLLFRRDSDFCKYAGRETKTHKQRNKRGDRLEKVNENPLLINRIHRI